MKATPRRYENTVAEYLSAWFSKYNLPPVVRIPVIGRRGPDVSWNDVMLIVDAKRRKAFPKEYSSFPTSEIVRIGDLIAVRMDSLDLLLSDKEPAKTAKKLVTVAEWWGHMASWPEMPVGAIPAVIAGKPGTRISTNPLFILEKDREVLRRRICNGR